MCVGFRGEHAHAHERTSICTAHYLPTGLLFSFSGNRTSKVLIYTYKYIRGVYRVSTFFTEHKKYNVKSIVINKLIKLTETQPKFIVIMLKV